MENKTYHTTFCLPVWSVKMCFSNPKPLVKCNLDNLCQLQFSSSAASLTGLQFPGVAWTGRHRTTATLCGLWGLSVERTDVERHSVSCYSCLQSCLQLLTNSVLGSMITLSKNYFRNTRTVLSSLASQQHLKAHPCAGCGQMGGREVTFRYL